MKFLFLSAALMLSSVTAWAMPSHYNNLGVIGDAGTFTFDTTGSHHRGGSQNGNNLDTELGIWNLSGDLLANDDDGGTGYFSSITIALGAGVYFLGASEWNSNFANNFHIGGNRLENGERARVILNINGDYAGRRNIDDRNGGSPENAFFRVVVREVTGGVTGDPVVQTTEPGSLALIALGIAGIGFARRKAS